MLVVNVMELVKSVKLNALLELFSLKREKAFANLVHQNKSALMKECPQVVTNKQSKEKTILAKSCAAGLFGTNAKVDSCTLCDARFSLDKTVTDREINHGITPCKLIPDGFYLEQNVNLAPCDFDASCFIQVIFLD